VKNLRLALLVGAAALVLSSYVLAQTVPAKAAEQIIPFKKDDDTGALLLRGVLGLVVALGIGIGCLYLAKRSGLANRLTPQTGKSLRIVETMRVGARANVTVIEFNNEQFVLAQSGQALSLQPIQRSNQTNPSLPLAQQNNNNNVA
jgi:flagellar biogenesis protein FliO